METFGFLFIVWKKGDEEIWGVRCVICYRVLEKYSLFVIFRGIVVLCKGFVLNLLIVV